MLKFDFFLQMCSIDVKMSLEKLFALQLIADFGSDHDRAPIFQVTVESHYLLFLQLSSAKMAVKTSI